MLSALGRLRAGPVPVVRDDAANEEPAEDETRDIGERIPPDGQRPPLDENRIDGRKRQDEHRHRRGPDALASRRRQDRAGWRSSRSSLPSAELVAREPLIDWLGGLGDRPQRFGKILETGFAAGRCEPRRSLDRLVPGRSPHAVAWPSPRRPGQHRRVERHAARFAERRQHALRDRRARPGSRPLAARARAGRRRDRTGRPAPAGRSPQG